MEPISFITTFGVFMAYFVIDWLFAEYTMSIVALKKMKAANVGALIYLLSAYGVVNFVGDIRYIIPMCMGGWLGTYLSVWLKEKK